MVNAENILKDYQSLHNYEKSVKVRKWNQTRLVVVKTADKTEHLEMKVLSVREKVQAFFGYNGLASSKKAILKAYKKDTNTEVKDFKTLIKTTQETLKNEFKTSAKNHKTIGDRIVEAASLFNPITCAKGLATLDKFKNRLIDDTIIGLFQEMLEKQPSNNTTKQSEFWDKLLKNIDANCVEHLMTKMDSKGNTLLSSAITKNNPELVKIFIKHGANIASQDGSGNLPIHIAAQHTISDEIWSLLTNKTIDVNTQNNLGETPLHIACTRNNENAIKQLVNLKADVSIRDNSGQQPLHKLATTTTQSTSACDLLIKHGADVLAVDNSYDTPLTLAFKENKRLHQFMNNTITPPEIQKIHDCFYSLDSSIRGTVLKKLDDGELIYKWNINPEEITNLFYAILDKQQAQFYVEKYQKLSLYVVDNNQQHRSPAPLLALIRDAINESKFKEEIFPTSNDTMKEPKMPDSQASEIEMKKYHMENKKYQHWLLHHIYVTGDIKPRWY